MRFPEFSTTTLSWRPVLRLCWVLLLGAGLTSGWYCYADKPEPAELRQASVVARQWNRLLLELERHTMGYRPPVSARMFAYVEMAGYEASLPGMRGYISMEDFVPGYQKPDCQLADDQFYVPASLNAAYAEIFRNFFSTAPDKLRQEIDHLEQQLYSSFADKSSKQVLEQSVHFGQKAATAIWTWSKTDREGHDGNLYNYDHNYDPVLCAGCWKPTGTHPSPALLPYWGRVRTFVVPVNDIAPQPPIAYDEKPGSEFHTEAMEVYSLSKPLSKENQWIAEFWSDDVPGLTVSPAGRWISVANQAFDKTEAPFGLVIETYLKLSIALCDVGIHVWNSKYLYNLERPETYIQSHINPEWLPLHDSPSFPSYPSGHSAFGAAAAEVLTEAFGDHCKFTDHTHENRPEFAGRPRTYGSFQEMAQENASSRVLLGVHYRMDCVEGLRVGKMVGQKIVALPLHHKEASIIGR